MIFRRISHGAATEPAAPTLAGATRPRPSTTAAQDMLADAASALTYRQLIEGMWAILEARPDTNPILLEKLSNWTGQHADHVMRERKR